MLLWALILGIIQGLTEFIPVSSSGHLILAEKLFNAPVGDLLFDVMLHIGTLAALVIYFRKEIAGILTAVFKGGDRRLGLYIALGTVPAIILGLLLQPLAEDSLRSTGLVAFNLLVVGLVMLWVDRLPGSKDVEKMNNPSALAIGAAQGLALIPGVSRSGITIVAGRWLGFSREAAARFSFLLAIPVTFGAILKLSFSGNVGNITSNISVFMVGILAAAISGYLAIDFLLKFLAKHKLAVFAYYRIGLAILVIAIGLLR